MTTAHAAIAERYGSARPPAGRPPRRRGFAIAAAAGIAVMIALAAWYSFAPRTTPTDPTTIGYEVVDSTRTIAHVSVVPDAERTIECIVQATNEQEAIVGFREVTVDPDPAADESRPAQLRLDIATTQLAASGHVDSCWFLD
ncbi:DUF4307 domain-containing protein [Brevibacterium sp. NPDC049920]|uniref:DUF4307 domain-containing protein n=1 Tax=Brevibacterium pityocampae TaxID=506594 RepID=A0ABP8JS93_9MICO|nr:DUF4307 domain-containing protein [uncultured Brevibacterium sp.]